MFTERLFKAQLLDRDIVVEEAMSGKSGEVKKGRLHRVL